MALVAIGAGSIAALNATKPPEMGALNATSTREGRTLHEKHGRQDREFVVRAKIVEKSVRSIDTVTDRERGRAPTELTLTHGTSFNDKDEQTRTGLSGDWSDREQYDKLVVGREYEFHIVTEAFYGKYYGIVQAFPVIDGVLQEEDVDGLSGSKYRPATD